MKIYISELRKIVRSILIEQGWVPGRWNPVSGVPVSDEDISCMGTVGLGCKDEEEYTVEEDENSL